LFFNNDKPVGLFNAFKNRVPIQWPDGAQVYDFSTDAFFFQFFCSTGSPFEVGGGG
jgi:hypothetical protein